MRKQIVGLRCRCSQWTTLPPSQIAFLPKNNTHTAMKSGLKGGVDKILAIDIH